jgi:hypothetical protein
MSLSSGLSFSSDNLIRLTHRISKLVEDVRIWVVEFIFRSEVVTHGKGLGAVTKRPLARSVTAFPPNRCAELSFQKFPSPIYSNSTSIL